MTMEYPMQVSIVVASQAQLASVYALLGGAAPAAVARGTVAAVAEKALPVEHVVKHSAAAADATVGETAIPAAATGENTGKKDAAGTVFDAARHTGSIVKSGLWRMKTGLSRPAGEGEDAIPKEGVAAVTGAATAAAAPVAAVEEDDEFAAFTKAANAGAPVEVKARTWTDADLSKLTNQAAQKLGSPDMVKAAIAKFVKPGETPHSRNIPDASREAFAKEVEAAAGIEYAG